MLTTVSAVALRRFTHAENGFLKDAFLPGLTASQFADWELVGLVRAATDGEVAEFLALPAVLPTLPAALTPAVEPAQAEPIAPPAPAKRRPRRTSKPRAIPA